VSRQWGEVFAADGPIAIIGEGWCVFVWCAVPSCGHHCGGGKQAAVGGQVNGQVFSLLTMSVGQVPVFWCVHEEGFYSKAWFAEASGGHCKHRIVPSPRGLPVPVLKDFVQCAAHCFWVGQVSRRQQSESGNERGMVTSKCRICEGVRCGLGCHIQAVCYGQR
jgi:hypothetical protein